jgi:hypothetical protein
MIVSGSGTRPASTCSPTVTAPSQLKMLTPTPALPAVGTRPSTPASLAPANHTGSRGPGTLVITAVALR